MSRPASPDISVVIPVYNRGEIIRYTLESVRRASEGLSVEVIVVDDGSAPPAAESIVRLEFAPERILRQSNRACSSRASPVWPPPRGGTCCFSTRTT